MVELSRPIHRRRAVRGTGGPAIGRRGGGGHAGIGRPGRPRRRGGGARLPVAVGRGLAGGHGFVGTATAEPRGLSLSSPTLLSLGFGCLPPPPPPPPPPLRLDRSIGFRSSAPSQLTLPRRARLPPCPPSASRIYTRAPASPPSPPPHASARPRAPLLAPSTPTPPRPCPRPVADRPGCGARLPRSEAFSSLRRPGSSRRPGQVWFAAKASAFPPPALIWLFDSSY